MKKLLLMAVVLLSSVGAFAQHTVGSVTFQPKVGMNLAGLTNLDKDDRRLGLAAGAEFEYQATPVFSLSAGALYSMQGTQDDKDNTLKMDYINVPVLANVYVAPGLALKAGLQPGFLVNSSSSDTYKSVDLSIPVGVSYEYENFVLDARYNFGVTNVVKDDINRFINSDCKNSVFQLTLGYKFDL